jgi:hypothetical protein
MNRGKISAICIIGAVPVLIGPERRRLMLADPVPVLGRVDPCAGSCRGVLDKKRLNETKSRLE